MIFGIDFGTTYTLVTYYNKDKIKFIKFKVNCKRSKFLPTNKFGVDQLKRLIEQNNLKNEKINKSLLNFFIFLKKTIDAKFKEKIVNCVLTVPVRFNDLSKNLIKKCAIEAGFFILKLLSEPVAAGFCVLSTNKIKTNDNFLVYDLGGGTFDLSLFKIEDDVYQVLKTDGLNNFGGIDIDKIISDSLKINLKQAEKLKQKDPINSKTRQIIADKLKTTFNLVDEITKNIKINKIILAGGSSKLKLIEETLKKKYEILKVKDLQTIVAKGALMYAKALEDNSSTLIDVIPFNLGIELLNNEIDVVIMQNHPLPISITRSFVSLTNNTKINIIQGVGDNLNEYTSLMVFDLKNTKEFSITFCLDFDGILSIKIFNSFFNKVFVLSSLNNNNDYNEKINQMLQEVYNLKIINSQQEELIMLMNNIKNHVIKKEAFDWIEEKFKVLFKENE